MRKRIRVQVGLLLVGKAKGHEQLIPIRVQILPAVEKGLVLLPEEEAAMVLLLSLRLVDSRINPLLKNRLRPPRTRFTQVQGFELRSAPHTGKTDRIGMAERDSLPL